MGDFITENLVWLGLFLGWFFYLCSLHKRHDDEKKAKAEQLERIKREADDAVERVKDKQRREMRDYERDLLKRGGIDSERVRFSDRERIDYAGIVARNEMGSVITKEREKREQSQKKIKLEKAREFYEQQVYGQQERARRDDNDLLYTAGAFALINHHASMVSDSSSSSGSSHSSSHCSRDDDSSSSSCWSSSSSDSGSSSWRDD